MTKPSGKYAITPLMAAVMSYNTSIVEFILSRDLHHKACQVPDIKGMTPLEMAEYKNLRTIRDMIKQHLESPPDSEEMKQIIDHERQYAGWRRTEVYTREQEHLTNFKPSTLFKTGRYPEYDLMVNGYTLPLFSEGYYYFKSHDRYNVG